ncbi:hypothetical protein SAMN05444172_1577 [Burkholderia sp. GAS332]|nr:hypothetical protein SAMN05444172_1577 [Burkholderia sp. GAS332]
MSALDAKLCIAENGEEYYEMGPASTIAPISGYAYRDDEDATPGSRAKAKTFMDGIFATARESRFKRADILETLLVRGEWSRRVATMIEQMVVAVGNERLALVFDEFRLLKD